MRKRPRHISYTRFFRLSDKGRIYIYGLIAVLLAFVCALLPLPSRGYAASALQVGDLYNDPRAGELYFPNGIGSGSEWENTFLSSNAEIRSGALYASSPLSGNIATWIKRECAQTPNGRMVDCLFTVKDFKSFGANNGVMICPTNERWFQKCGHSECVWEISFIYSGTTETAPYGCQLFAEDINLKNSSTDMEAMFLQAGYASPSYVTTTTHFTGFEGGCDFIPSGAPTVFLDNCAVIYSSGQGALTMRAQSAQVGSWFINPKSGPKPEGALSISAKSAEPDITDGNNCYSLEGIAFGVYRDVSFSDPAAIFSLDSSGGCAAQPLIAGTYYLRPMNDSFTGKGYIAGPSSKNGNEENVVVIEANVQQTISFELIPQKFRPGIILNKCDAETQSLNAQGSASLAGALYNVSFYSKMLSDTETPQTLEPLWTVQAATDDNGALSLSDMQPIPLGTLIIKEQVSPTGYLLADVEHIVQITSAGNTEFITEIDPPKENEQIKRGDIDFTAASGDDSNRLADLPFVLTSKTTGEQHVLVTDKNGYVSTESTWNRHSENTNADDVLIDAADIDMTPDHKSGIWFGVSKLALEDYPEPIRTINDSVGALPFDTYTLKELPCAKNSDRELVQIDDISIYRHNSTVHLGTIDVRNPRQLTMPQSNRTVDSPEIAASPIAEATSPEGDVIGTKLAQTGDTLASFLERNTGAVIILLVTAFCASILAFQRLHKCNKSSCSRDLRERYFNQFKY